MSAGRYRWALPLGATVSTHERCMFNSEVGVIGHPKIRAYLVPDDATTRTARSGGIWI
jgi:hypothetical protein